MSRSAKHQSAIGNRQSEILGGWLRGRDLNPRPLGYEPNELPDCSTPRQINRSRVRAEPLEPATARSPKRDNPKSRSEFEISNLRSQISWWAWVESNYRP